ncbi:MAG: hypothetical protein K0R29_1949 [Pseudobdellovibrio sp.]|jgi:hypothetical protein|nr:hypothetical protein [Pseudobdellovibrio sp.]
MKNSKYLIFLAIGFELVGLVLVAVYAGDYLVAQGYSKSLPAFLVIGAMVVWFVSLFLKLQKLKK